jgi:hypothetical protein
MKITFIECLICAFIVGICLKIYFDSDLYNLKCIISDVDGEKYCVRERDKLELAADLLANVTKRMKKLVEYMKVNYPQNDNVDRLIENFNPQKISETLPTSEFTAYSENKGEKLAFCLNTSKNGNRLIDPNTLTFVAIHELAHTMTESIGHEEEFWDNFKFLLENAVKCKIYRPVDYSKKPKDYCGMKINESPLYKK